MSVLYKEKKQGIISTIIENKKPKLRVFVNGSLYCIENSVAYALGILNLEEFGNSEEKYYYITDDMLPILRKNYDLEICSLKSFEAKQSKFK